MAKQEQIEVADSPKNRGKTKISRCGCAHDFQNERYDLGLRVHNCGAKGKRTCTCCGKTN